MFFLYGLAEFGACGELAHVATLSFDSVDSLFGYGQVNASAVPAMAVQRTALFSRTCSVMDGISYVSCYTRCFTMKHRHMPGKE
jgi:hypothetical protein